MRIVINTSEVANIIGKNKYQCQEEAYLNMLARNYNIPVDELNEFANLTVNDIILIATENNIKLDEKKLKDKNTNIKQIAKEVIDQSIQKSIQVDNVEQSKKLEKEVVNILNTNLNKDTTSVQEYIKSNINKKRGVINEDKIIKAYETKNKKQVKGNNAKCYTMTLGELPNDINLLLCGKVDGIEDEYIIEVKNRRNRLFMCIPIYEQIQIECYLRLTGLKKAKLIENYNNTQNIIEYYSDDELWEEILYKLKNKSYLLDT